MNSQVRAKVVLNTEEHVEDKSGETRDGRALNNNGHTAVSVLCIHSFLVFNV